MGQSADITEDELKVFLQETDEQLQLLDEDIVRLEKEAQSADLIQEIFRAAHTLKGSSAMLGFHEMAELTHAMEDVLDRVRKGALAVSGGLVDLLLESLDSLKVLRKDLTSDDKSGVDVSPLAEALRASAEGMTDESSEGQHGGTPDLSVPPETVRHLEAAAAAGQEVYGITVGIDVQAGWSAVRCLQVLNELSNCGEVVHSQPTEDEVDGSAPVPQIWVLLATTGSGDEICRVAHSVDDVVTVDVAAWSRLGAGLGTTAEDGVGAQNSDAAKIVDLVERARALPASERGTAAQSRGVQDDASYAGEDRRVVDLGAEARGTSAAAQLALAGRKIEALQTLRIDVEQLDAIMNMVGELVVDRTSIDQIAGEVRSRYKNDEAVQSLTQTCGHVAKVVDELNEKMMLLRMVPVGALFSRFPRLVRDLAHESGKAVDFAVEGQDTQIDRSMIEKIKDPLVHLLRNAVDHGVEPPDARKQRGKPVPARVKLSAVHREGHIVITLEDDGKGIDPDSIRSSAVAKGIVTAEAAERLSASEALDLIFASGLSTAEKTTEISGRGVGMDVVKKGVEALNGIVEIDTTPGVGTSFTLRLPLTLATFEGLLVSSGGAVYAIPVNYVQETVKLEAAYLGTVMGREVLNLRGSIMPLLRLGAICGRDHDNCEWGGSQFVVVVRAGDRGVGLAVDALMQQQEVVVKSLGGYMGRAKGIAGASILGDGRVALILDMATLMRMTAQTASGPAELERRAS